MRGLLRLVAVGLELAAALGSFGWELSTSASTTRGLIAGGLACFVAAGFPQPAELPAGARVGEVPVEFDYGGSSSPAGVE